MLSFRQALNVVQEKLAAVGVKPGAEIVPLLEARGRVLAEDVSADRDYPPFHRSIRDGFAVRAADLGLLPAELRVVGEIPAGGHFDGEIAAGECALIMTGAPMPAGADSVVMVEYTESHGDKVKILRCVQSDENVVQRGSEALAGSTVLPRGRRLSAFELGLLASVGQSQVRVYVRPEVAILSTGDEVVPVDHRPEWFQIRNSNAVSLAAQVAAAGGIPRCLPIAPDHPKALRELILEGLKSGLLLLTGGVSAGKYDFVEPVLADLGAEFHFQSVALRPGKPLVFGQVAGRFFFGLPGNPVSTNVTFALFARPVVSVLAGAGFDAAPFLRARLGHAVKPNPHLTAFLPARLDHASGEPVVSLVGWQGSGDMVAVAAADCFMVVHPDTPGLAAGDWVDVMLKEN